MICLLITIYVLMVLFCFGFASSRDDAQGIGYGMIMFVACLWPVAVPIWMGSFVHGLVQKVLR
jgi:hypothetical protein